MAAWLELLFNVPVQQSFIYKNIEPYVDTPLIGRRAQVTFRSRKMTGFIVGEQDELDDHFPISKQKIKPIERVVDSEPLFSVDHIALSSWVSRFYLCSQGEALSAMLPSAKREAAGMHGFSYIDVSEQTYRLSSEQNTAVATICAATKADFFYLYGVTGSGKTEVFLKAAEHILQKGLSVMYLVPEIALTHQVVQTVTKRFGEMAAVLHSGLTGSRRFTEWMRIKRGQARIIVGARSAIFAPVQQLGLIVIDEEHDGSYKSGSTPRYHARQVAMYLARIHGCPLVMGSATPSVEAWHMMEKNIIHRLTLTHRLAGGTLPAMSIVPLYASSGALTTALIQSIRAVKAAGGQTILFLNRRGFAHFFKCRLCGYQMLCKNCSVALTWYKSRHIMKCHYCGWQTSPPEVCPECGSTDVGYSTIGTEYIEEEVRRTFPRCSVARIDSDTSRTKGGAQKILDDFRDGTIDILLGTQMIAKGLNFPNLQLVGIISADTGLHIPDFRAAERSFALITQVAGRAGRYTPNGSVIIQTWNPEHPAIVCAKEADADRFYRSELEQRRIQHFPPFSRLIRLVFRSKNENKAEAAAVGAARILRDLLSPEVELLGPSECIIPLIAENHRFQLLLRHTRSSQMQTAVSRFLNEYSVQSGVYIEVDVDPVQLL